MEYCFYTGILVFVGSLRKHIGALVHISAAILTLLVAVGVEYSDEDKNPPKKISCKQCMYTYHARQNTHNIRQHLAFVSKWNVYHQHSQVFIGSSSDWLQSEHNTQMNTHIFILC